MKYNNKKNENSRKLLLRHKRIRNDKRLQYILIYSNFIFRIRLGDSRPAKIHIHIQ